MKAIKSICYWVCSERAWLQAITKVKLTSLPSAASLKPWDPSHPEEQILAAVPA